MSKITKMLSLLALSFLFLTTPVFADYTTWLWTGQNGAVQDNSTDNAVTITENSENIIYTFGANAIVVTSSTGVTSLTYTGIDLTLGDVALTGDITLKNGATIVNTSANLLTITELTVDVVGILTANSIASDGAISAAGLLTATGGVDVAGVNTTAINVSVAQTDETGLDAAAVFQHGTYSNGLAYGAQAAHLILKSTHISASTTGATYVFGDINMITTSDDSLGYMNVSYDYLSIGHNLVNGWATRGRVDITATSELGEMSGLLGTLDVAASTVITANGAAVLAAAILDLQVNTGATVAQEVTCLEVRPHIKADIVGVSSGIRININCSSVNYVDYGLDIRSMSANQTAAIRILATPASDALATAIWIEGSDGTTSTITDGVSFAGNVTNVLRFDAVDGGSGASTSAACDTDGQDSDAAIRVDVNGTAYYIPLFNADHTSTSW